MSDVFHSMVAGDVTLESLSSLRLPELASLYHEITGQVSEPARTKEEMVERVGKALRRAFEIEKGINIIQLGRPLPIDYRAKAYHSDPAYHRTGSKLGALMRLLADREAPTIEECVAIFKGSKPELIRNLYRINFVHGYGIRETNGRIHMYRSEIVSTPGPIDGLRSCIIEPYPSRKVLHDAELHCIAGPLDQLVRLRRTRQVVRSVPAGSAVGSSEDGEGNPAYGPGPLGGDGDCGYGDSDLGLFAGPRKSESEGSPGRQRQGTGEPYGHDRHPRGDDLRAGEADRGLDGAGDGSDQGDPEPLSEPTFPLPVRVRQITLDRLNFLLMVTKSVDQEEVVIRAIHYFDLAVCAILDGAKLRATHRNGTVEDFKP